MELEDFYKVFPTHIECFEYLENIIWRGKPVCPYCKTDFNTAIKGTGRHHCNKCNTSFSVTVNTIFHKTKCDLRKWFYTIHESMNGKRLSVRELGLKLGVTKDTALKMSNKIAISKIKNPDFLNEINSSFVNPVYE